MLIDLLVVDNRIPNEVYTRWFWKIQEFFMVFSNSNLQRIFVVILWWPEKTQDYKLSYVRSKNLIRFTRLKNSEKLNCLKLVIKNLKNSIKMTRLPLNGISYGKIWFLYMSSVTYVQCKWYVTYRGFVTYCVRRIRKRAVCRGNLRVGESSEPI